MGLPGKEKGRATKKPKNPSPPPPSPPPPRFKNLPSLRIQADPPLPRLRIFFPFLSFFFAFQSLQNANNFRRGEEKGGSPAPVSVKVDRTLVR